MEKILIIEDDQDLREEVLEILIAEGFHALQASTGDEGINMSFGSVPDLILCDISMYPVNGFEVLTRIKEKPETSMIPFIFITGLFEPRYFRKGMEMGADDYLLKPFRRKELLKTIDVRLKKRDMIYKKTDQLKRNILMSIPHEMRTPLHAILGLSEFIKTEAWTQTTDDISELASLIYESGNALHQIINKYLLFVDIEIHGHAVPFSFLQDTADFIGKIALETAKKYGRVNDVELGLAPCCISINTEWFRFAMTELTDNAFKFSEPGTKVIIRSGSASEGIEFSIQDAGRGISQENLRMIDAFMQFERPRYAQQGIGLGLFLSGKIIGLSNGSFNVTSQPGKGTTVSFRLPEVNSL